MIGSTFLPHGSLIVSLINRSIIYNSSIVRDWKAGSPATALCMQHDGWINTVCITKGKKSKYQPPKLLCTIIHGSEAVSYGEHQWQFTKEAIAKTNNKAYLLRHVSLLTCFFVCLSAPPSIFCVALSSFSVVIQTIYTHFSPRDLRVLWELWACIYPPADIWKPHFVEFIIFWIDFEDTENFSFTTILSIKPSIPRLEFNRQYDHPTNWS